MPEATLQIVPLERLSENPKNPRTIFDKDKIAELADSIARVGLQSPILVRPTEGKKLQIVAGHRRFRAAKVAGVKEVPVLVKPLSDEETFEISLIENLQRADLHPLEEGAAFQKMVDLGRTPIEIAERCHRPAPFVRQRLRLNGLIPAIQEAFIEGKIPVGVANHLARIDSRDDQGRALKELRGRTGQLGELSVRDAIQQIENQFMLRLADAPFAPEDVKLFPDAGPCSACPKRSGNQKSMFPDIGDPDLCQDAVCFRKKADNAWLDRAAKALDRGLELLDEKEAERVFQKPNWGNDAQLRSGGDWKLGEETRYTSNGYEPLSAFAKRNGIDPIVARDPYTMRIVELFRKDQVSKAERQANIKKARHGNRPVGRTTEEIRDTQAREEAEDRAQLAAIVAGLSAARLPEVVCWACEELLDKIPEDFLPAFALRRGLGKGIVETEGDQLSMTEDGKLKKECVEWLREAGAKELAGALFELVAVNGDILWMDDREEAFDDFGKALKLDLKAIRKDARAAFEEAEKAKKAAPAKAEK